MGTGNRFCLFSGQGLGYFKKTGQEFCGFGQIMDGLAEVQGQCLGGIGDSQSSQQSQGIVPIRGRSGAVLLPGKGVAVLAGGNEKNQARFEGENCPQALFAGHYFAAAQGRENHIDLFWDGTGPGSIEAADVIQGAALAQPGKVF